MSPGDVHPHVLRSCAAQMAVPVAIIFNKSICTGLLRIWLQIIAVPLFKARLKYDSGKCSSISLTSVCCKTMKRIVAGKLVNYVKVVHNVHCGRQFGLRKCRSTEDQMLLVYSEIAEMVDEGLVIRHDFASFFKGI